MNPTKSLSAINRVAFLLQQKADPHGSALLLKDRFYNRSKKLIGIDLVFIRQDSYKIDQRQNSAETTARDIPQPGQGICKKVWNKQSIPRSHAIASTPP